MLVPVSKPQASPSSETDPKGQSHPNTVGGQETQAKLKFCINALNGIHGSTAGKRRRKQDLSPKVWMD